MDQENVDYLYSISKRVSYYFNVRKKAISYLLNNRINNKELSINVILMSAIWAAHQLGEDLTEEQLFTIFGLAPKDDSDLNNVVMRLHPDQHHLTLEEILDITVERSGKNT